MRVTKSSEAASSFAAMKVAANKGCDKCPCCGETKTMLEYMRDGVYNKGVDAGILNKTWVEGVFLMKSMKCDCYKCHSCGAEWESEPYQWT